MRRLDPFSRKRVTELEQELTRAAGRIDELIEQLEELNLRNTDLAHALRACREERRHDF